MAEKELRFTCWNCQKENTVIVPVAEGLSALGAVELLLEQPTAVTATRPAAIAVKRRIIGS